MNIETSNINQTKDVKISTSQKVNNQEPSVKFADELNKDKNVEQVQEDDLDSKKESKIIDKTETINKVEKNEKFNMDDIQNKIAYTNKNNSITNDIDKLNQEVDSNNKNSENLDLLNNNLLKKDLNSAFQNMNTLVNEFNQLDDKSFENIKNDDVLADNKDMINNDFNIQKKRSSSKLPLSSKKNSTSATKKIWDKEKFSGTPYKTTSFATTVVEVELDTYTYNEKIKGIWISIDCGEILDISAAKKAILLDIQQELSLLVEGKTVTCDKISINFLPSESNSGQLHELVHNTLPAAFSAALSSALATQLTELPCTEKQIFELIKEREVDL